MSNKLSPPAQAVLDALGPHKPEQIEFVMRCIATDALRAAADHVKPSQQNYTEAPHALAKACLNGMAFAANELRCLADELDPRSENA